MKFVHLLHFDFSFPRNGKERIALSPIGLSGRLSFVLVHNIKLALGQQQQQKQKAEPYH